MVKGRLGLNFDAHRRDGQTACCWALCDVESHFGSNPTSHHGIGFPNCQWFRTYHDVAGLVLLNQAVPVGRLTPDHTVRRDARLPVCVDERQKGKAPYFVRSIRSARGGSIGRCTLVWDARSHQNRRVLLVCLRCWACMPAHNLVGPHLKASAKFFAWAMVQQKATCAQQDRGLMHSSSCR